MRGTGWDGTRFNFTTKMGPFRDVMNRQQRIIGVSGRELSASQGQSRTWFSELTGKAGLVNPNLSRMARWVQLLDGQEFGLSITTADSGYHTFPVYDIDEPPPWTIRDGTQYAELREVLIPFQILMRRQRRYLHRTAQEFADSLGVPRGGISDLEGGAGLQNPSLGRLYSWAQSVKALTFGVYVILGGECTEVELLLGDNDA